MASKQANLKLIVQNMYKKQENMLSTLKAMRAEIDQLKRSGLGGLSAACTPLSGSLLSDVIVTTPQTAVDRREIVGLVFPFNSLAALLKFCDLWKKSEESWRSAKIAKGVESDEEALKVLPKPDHLKLVQF